MTCERCEFIEAEYAHAEAEDLTRDALVLALAAARVERNRLRESEKKREEWQAIAENTMDASSEGAWMARALDAERELAGLREFVGDQADEDCHYGDNCPSNAGTRHGTCRSCRARQTLAECHSRADSGHMARKGES